MQIHHSATLHRHLIAKVALLLAPVSLAWLVFGQAITQDGPAHLAASHLANQCLAGSPHVSAIYQLHFQPLPNWGGQALGMLLLQLFSPIWANRLINLAGLWLPAVGLAVLAARVSEIRAANSWPVALWISLLAMNVTWTFGFTSFLLGLGLGWLVLAQVWVYAQNGGRWQWLTLAVGWPLLFLTHLVAYAISGLVCGCLLLATPGWALKRRLRVALAVAVSFPFLIQYRRITAGAGLELIWEHLDWSHLSDMKNWARQLGWIDPISLASRRWLPILEMESLWAALFQPVLWILPAIILMIKSQWPKMEHGLLSQQRGFLLAFLLLTILGLLGPDSLGREQGHYLPQRILLGALSVLACIWPGSGKSSRWVPFCLFMAWSLQSIFAVEFGRKSGVYAESLRRSYASIPENCQILALIDARPWAYRANPTLHADALAVTAGQGIASLNLYEAAYGYFPLQFRSIPPGLEPRRLERISLMRSPAEAAQRAAEITSVLQSATGRADVILVLAEADSTYRTAVSQLIMNHSGWVLIQSSNEVLIYRRDGSEMK